MQHSRPASTYLSGRANLRVVADYAGVSQKRVDEVLDIVELSSRAGRKFGTCSTGKTGSSPRFAATGTAIGL